MTTYTADEVTDLASGVLQDLRPGIMVRVAGIEFSSDPPTDGSELNVAGQITVRVGAEIEAVEGVRTFVVASKYDLTTYKKPEAEDAEAERFGWSCTVDIHAQWTTAAEQLTDDQLRAFAVRVGMMTLHPYARSTVQATVAASGWNTFTIDVIGQQDHLFASDDDPEQLDLSGIEVLTNPQTAS